MRVHRTVGAIIGLVLSATAASSAELLINGGFESGNFTPNVSLTPTYDLISDSGPQDLTGWTVGDSLVWGKNTIDINPRTGSGFVDLTGVGDTRPHGSLSQVISTIIGQDYTFSIFATQDFKDTIGFDVFANGAALLLSGTAGFWDYSATGAIYGQLTGMFTATSASTTIGIVGRTPTSSSPAQFMIGLDDASVTGPIPVSPVPIPAALPLLGAALGVMGLWSRRGRRANGSVEA